MLGESLEHICVDPALVPAAKAAAMNPYEQRRRLVAIGQVQIEDLLLVLAILLVRMGRRDALLSLRVSARCAR